MNKWQKVAVAVAIAVVVVSNYGYIFYGSTGVDSDGYFADQSGKKAAYEVHGAFKQAEVDQCFKELNIDPTPANLAKLERDIRSGKRTASHALQQCIEKKIDGYASPKEDVKKVAKAVKKAFAGEPKPQICGSIVYNPGDHVGGVLVQPPAGCKTPFTVEVTGSYSQSFSDGRYQIDGKTGLPVQSIPQYELAIMPVKDRSLFGIALINNAPVDNRIRYYGAVNLNINTPLKKNGYSDIIGSLRVDFYN